MPNNHKYKTALSDAKKLSLSREFKNVLITELDLPKAFDNLSMVEQQRHQIYQEISKSIDNIIQSPKPRIALRAALMDNLLKISAFEVLLPFQEDQVPLKLSGKLTEHVPALVSGNPLLENFFESFSVNAATASQEDIANTLNQAILVLSLWLLAFKNLRELMEDEATKDEIDWIDACYSSFCISHEYSYRRQLGLPNILEGEQAEMEARLYASWLEIVEQDHDDLRQAWGTLWKNIMKEDDIFKAHGK